MGDSAEKQDKPSSLLMTVFASCLLFGAWLSFLYPWIRYQFWQSDTFWLVEIGRLILDKHCLPTHDPYSFTASTAHWTVYQWLTEVLFGLANAVGGLTGVAVFGEILLAILFCVLIFRRMLKEGTNPIVGLAVIWLAAYAFYPDLGSLRPQLLSFVLFWLLAVVCADTKAGMPTRKALIQTFIIAVVWANCHVSFPIALLMLAANFAGSLLLYLRKVGDKKLPILFASMLAIFAAGTLVTPHGFGLWTFLASLHNLYSVEELQPLAWAAQPKLIAVAIFTFLSCFYLRKKVDLGDLFILVALVLIGNNCGRLIVYFCIFSCPVMGAALTQLLSAPLKQNILSRLSEALKSVALSRFYVLGIVLLSIFIVTRQPIYMRRNVPLQATTFLYEHPIAGNLFCSAHIGSYLIYKTHGAIPVFIDTRMDLYDADFVTRFTRALRDGEGWRELFAQYKIGAALVPNSFKLKEVLDKQPDWKPIYRDADFSLYTPTGQQK